MPYARWCGNCRLTIQLGDEGQQGDVPSAFDRRGQAPLMLGARARLASRADLASIAHEPLQKANILEVDTLVTFGAELADLHPCREATAVVSSVITHSDNLLALQSIGGIHFVEVGVVGVFMAIQEDELLSHQLSPIMALAFRAFPRTGLEPALNVDL